METVDHLHIRFTAILSLAFTCFLEEVMAYQVWRLSLKDVQEGKLQHLKMASLQ